MKKLKLILAVGLLYFTTGIQAKNYNYSTVKGDAMATRIYTLDNGLKVYLSVNKEKPRIQAHIAVRTGSRNDPAETTGLAHYLEHLMFKGTKLFGTSDAGKEAPFLDKIQSLYEQYRHITDPIERKKCYHQIDSVSQLAAQYNIPNEYDKLMATIGADGTNAYTSNDVTCYVENIPSNEVENWAKIQSDRFQNMVIRGFHTELEAVYEEYNIHLTSDIDKELTALYKKLYPTHPYGTQTTIGTQEHLKNPSIVNIKNYFNRYYVPNNIAICMAGDFNPDEVIAIIDRYFGSWQKSESLSRPEYPVQPILAAAVDTTVIGQEAEQLLLGWRFNRGADAQKDTLEVISSMLANGKAGLFEINLEQPLKIQGAGAFCEANTDYTSFIIQALPKDNQPLEELKKLVLDEVKKLKAGDFSDDLLPSVINNLKLNYFKSLDNNRSRVNLMVDAFINGADWDDVVGSLERMSKMTKKQIIEFTQRHFKDNYVCVYKRQGVDSTQKKIDKPAITPIPANRELSSKFLQEIKNSQVTPIQPVFVDYKKDLTVTKTKKGLPLLYKQNTQDGLFTLVFRYDFGSEDFKDLSLAADYLNYVGTDKKNVSQIKQDFYKLACNYSVSVGSHNTTVYLSGLNENLPQSLALFEDLLNHAKGDDAAYSKFVDMLLKVRADEKLDQRSNFSALRDYGIYGAFNDTRNILSEKELRSGNSQMLTDVLKRFAQYAHTVLYYGPYDVKKLSSLISKVHVTDKTLKSVPDNQRYTQQQTPTNEVIIAPYDAKNIYMMMYHNEGKNWSPKEAALQAVFNQYFGGGMNTVVFQELRETRGLAYSAAAYYNSPSRKGDTENYYTYIISQNDKMSDCVKVFNNILDTIPQSEDAFNIAKQSLMKDLQSARVTKFGILSSYLNAQELGLDHDIRADIYRDLPGIQLKDVVKFEKDNMAHKNYRYLILGDEKNLDMKTLEKIAPVKRVTTEQIFGY